MKHARIEINPAIMLGKPVFRGTRIPVELILRKIAAKVPVAEIVRDYPRLTEEDVAAALNYAADAVSTDEIMEFAEAAR
ncbi:MAG: DUF433 domain-containing protein [Lentisphaerae bacterium]|nr:DUF433 domain-containing protein [Lentisphaerota bacterium]